MRGWLGGNGRGWRRAAVAAALALVSLAVAGPVPAQPAEAPPTEGRLLVLNKKDATLLVLDVPSYTTLATIPVGREPHEVAVTPDGRKAYVSNVGDKTITVVDLAALRAARTVKADRFDVPHGLAVTPDGRWLLLTSEGSRRFFLIDAARDVVLRSVTTTQSRAHMLALTDGGRRAWAANVDSGTVSLLKLPELRVLRHLPVGDGPEGIAAAPNGKWVVVALQRADQVAILDGSNGTVLMRLPTGRTPIRVAITPNSFTALVSNRGSDDVTVLDLLARRVKGTIPVGTRPGGIAINADGSRAWVCNNDANSVSVISVPGMEVSRTLPAGAGPDGIAFVPRPPAPKARRKG